MKNTTKLLRMWINGQALSDFELTCLYKDLNEIIKALEGKGAMFEVFRSGLLNYHHSIKLAVHARGL